MTRTYAKARRSIVGAAALSALDRYDRERERRLAALAAWASQRYGVTPQEAARIVVRWWERAEETFVMLQAFNH